MANMLYRDFLKNLSNCPFCETQRVRILENDYAYLTMLGLHTTSIIS